MSRTANGFIVAAVLASALAGAARAELTTGGLTGSVTVAGGGAVPGAAIAVRSPSMMGTQSVASKQDGSFRMLLLPPGVYEVTVSAPGLSARVLSFTSFHISHFRVPPPE